MSIAAPLRDLDVRALPPRYYAGALGVIGLFVLPVFLTAPQLAAVIPVLFLVVFAMSWDFVSGYTGQISLGHTFFFALGGYGTTVLSLQHGIHPVASILVGTGLAALGGIVIGIPALRLRGPFLALVTLIAPLIFLQFAILFNDGLWVLAPNGLGGVAGFSTPNPGIAGLDEAAMITVDSYALAIIVEYYVLLTVVLAIAAVLYAITRSQIGAIFTAIREDEQVVAAVGFNPAKYKIYAFVVSGAVGGLAGALFVHSSAGNPLQPAAILQLTVAIEIIVIAVFGGMGTILGAAVGALFFAGFEVAAGSIDATIPLVGEPVSSFMPAPLFVVAAAIVMFRPEGLLPALIRFGGRFTDTDSGANAEAESTPSAAPPAIRRLFDRIRLDRSGQELYRRVSDGLSQLLEQARFR